MFLLLVGRIYSSFSIKEARGKITPSASSQFANCAFLTPLRCAIWTLINFARPLTPQLKTVWIVHDIQFNNRSSMYNVVVSYYTNLQDRPVVSTVQPGYLAPQLPSSAPEEGQPWRAIYPDIEKIIQPGITHWQHPAFMAFFPANSSFPGILGEMYSAMLNGAAFNWICSPAVTELETVMMDWVARALALPECFLSKGAGGGVIQGTASEAIIVVLIAARERLLRREVQRRGLKEDSKEAEAVVDSLRGGKLVAIGSDQSHSSTRKGAIIAGTKLRTVPTKKEDNFGMRGASLRRTLEECKAEGLFPFYLTVTLGTTSTCGIDNFAEIAEVVKDYPDLWVHVDAAHAGSALVCPEYQHHAAHWAEFDSFDFNMHKWLLTNFDCSCLYVKNRSDLTASLSITPSYLRNQFTDSGLVTDYRDWQLPLGRRFRSLKVWFVLRSYGLEGLRKHIRFTVHLGELFHSLVLTRPDLFSVFVPPAFALTVITVNPRRGRRRRTSANQPDPEHERYLNDFTPDAEANALVDANRITKDVYERVNSSGEVYLTSTVVAGVCCIRVVSASPWSEEKYVRRCFEVLVLEAEAVLDEEEA